MHIISLLTAFILGLVTLTISGCGESIDPQVEAERGVDWVTKYYQKWQPDFFEEKNSIFIEKISTFKPSAYDPFVYVEMIVRDQSHINAGPLCPSLTDLKRDYCGLFKEENPEIHLAITLEQAVKEKRQRKLEGKTTLRMKTKVGHQCFWSRRIPTYGFDQYCGRKNVGY